MKKQLYSQTLKIFSYYDNNAKQHTLNIIHIITSLIATNWIYLFIYFLTRTQEKPQEKCYICLGNTFNI